jgi:hypothetical protein
MPVTVQGMRPARNPARSTRMGPGSSTVVSPTRVATRRKTSARCLAMSLAQRFPRRACCGRWVEPGFGFEWDERRGRGEGEAVPGLPLQADLSMVVGIHQDGGEAVAVRACRDVNDGLVFGQSDTFRQTTEDFQHRGRRAFSCKELALGNPRWERVRGSCGDEVGGRGVGREILLQSRIQILQSLLRLSFLVQPVEAATGLSPVCKRGHAQ